MTSIPATPDRTKAQIVEDEDGLRLGHPLGRWLRHGERCPARQMNADLTALDGPCDCGLNARLSVRDSVGVDPAVLRAAMRKAARIVNRDPYHVRVAQEYNALAALNRRQDDPVKETTE